jgi:hypothetical protein
VVDFAPDSASAVVLVAWSVGVRFGIELVLFDEP